MAQRRALLLYSALLVVVTGSARSQAPPDSLVIGIVPSLMDDLTPGQRKFTTDEFPAMVKDFTGMNGKLVPGKSPMDVASQLQRGDCQFAVFQGIELAWAQAKHPSLKPLLQAVYHTPWQHAVLVTKKDGPAAKWADLKGKIVTIANPSNASIRLFVHKHTGGAGFFGKIVPPANPEAALDAILLDKVQAAVVDRVALDIYKEVNPGRFNRLKVVAESEPFPPGVIAYEPAKVSPAMVARFRDGMLKANSSNRGREVMGSFRITAFEPIPGAYAASLDAIRKLYPAPAETRP